MAREVVEWGKDEVEQIEFRRRMGSAVPVCAISKPLSLA